MINFNFPKKLEKIEELPDDPNTFYVISW